MSQLSPLYRQISVTQMLEYNRYIKMKDLILGLLICTASCLSTFTYNYYQVSLGADTIPVTFLPNLVSGDVITFNFTFFHNTGYTPIQFKPSLGINLMPLNPTAPGFNSVLDINFNGSNILTYTVGATDTYSLYTAPWGPQLSLQLFYLTVTSNNGTQIVKQVNFLTGSLFKLIYISTPSDVTVDCTTSSCFLVSIATDPSNYKLDALVNPSSTNSTSKIYTALATGYYFVGLSTSSPGTLTYQSDPYLCPYDTTYTDYRKLFEPCTTSLPSSDSTSAEGLVAWQIALIVTGAVITAAVLVVVLAMVAKTSSTSASTTVIPDSSAIIEEIKPSNSAGIGSPTKI